MKQGLYILWVLLFFHLSSSGQTQANNRDPVQIRFHGVIVSNAGNRITDGKAAVHITASSEPDGCIQDVLNMRVATDSTGTFSATVPVVARDIYYTVHHPDYQVAGGIIIVDTSVHFVRIPLRAKK